MVLSIIMNLMKNRNEKYLLYIILLIWNDDDTIFSIVAITIVATNII